MNKEEFEEFVRILDIAAQQVLETIKEEDATRMNIIQGSLAIMEAQQIIDSGL